MEKPIKIFASAGEVSGERILAQVIGELRPLLPEMILKGLGGSECRRKGLESLEPLEKLAVNGIWNVIIRFCFFAVLLGNISRILKKFRPDLIILVDYPGINKRILAFCKRRDIPVYYIAPPQIWPYRKWTGKTKGFEKTWIQVLFNLEKEPYRSAGANVSAGHFFNLPDRIPEKREVLCICPGSRLPTIKRNLPYFLALLKNSRYAPEGFVNTAVLVPEELIGATKDLYGRAMEFPLQIFSEKENLFQKSKAAIAFPGTITLELALWNIPTLVLGVIDPLTYIVGKLVLKTKWLSLPNALMGRMLFPEFVSWKRNLNQEKFDALLNPLMNEPFQNHNLAEKIGRANGSEVARDNCLSLLRDSRSGNYTIGKKGI